MKQIYLFIFILCIGYNSNSVKQTEQLKTVDLKKSYSKPLNDDQKPNVDPLMISYIQSAPYNKLLKETMDIDFFNNYCQTVFNEDDKIQIFYPISTEESLAIEKEFRENPNDSKMSSLFLMNYLLNSKKLSKTSDLVNNLFNSFRSNQNYNNEFGNTRIRNQLTEEMFLKQFLLVRIHLIYKLNLKYESHVKNTFKCLKNNDYSLSLDNCIDSFSRMQLQNNIFWGSIEKFNQFQGIYEKDCRKTQYRHICNEASNYVNEQALIKLSLKKDLKCSQQMKENGLDLDNQDQSDESKYDFMDDYQKQNVSLKRKVADYVSSNESVSINQCMFPDLQQLFWQEVSQKVKCKQEKQEVQSRTCRNYNRFHNFKQECDSYNHFQCKELRDFDKYFTHEIQKMHKQQDKHSMNQRSKFDFIFFQRESNYNEEMKNEVKEKENLVLALGDWEQQRTKFIERDTDYYKMLSTDNKTDGTVTATSGGLSHIFEAYRDLVKNFANISIKYLFGLVIASQFLVLTANINTMTVLAKEAYDDVDVRKLKGPEINLDQMSSLVQSRTDVLFNLARTSLFYIGQDIQNRFNEIYQSINYDKLDQLREFCATNFPESQMSQVEQEKMRKVKIHAFTKSKIIYELFHEYYSTLDIMKVIPHLFTIKNIWSNTIKRLSMANYLLMIFFLIGLTLILLLTFSYLTLTNQIIILLAARKNDMTSASRQIIQINQIITFIKLLQISCNREKIVEVQINNQKYLDFLSQEDNRTSLINMIKNAVVQLSINVHTNENFKKLYLKVLMMANQYIAYPLQIFSIVKRGSENIDFSKAKYDAKNDDAKNDGWLRKVVNKMLNFSKKHSFKSKAMKEKLYNEDDKQKKDDASRFQENRQKKFKSIKNKIDQQNQEYKLDMNRIEEIQVIENKISRKFDQIFNYQNAKTN